MTQKRYTRLLPLLLPLLLLASCRSSQPAAPTPGAERDKPWTPQYTTMSFSGDVDGISFSGQVRMAKDSVIWCNVSKIFDMGRAMATPDSVWLRAPLLGYNETGDYNMVKKKTGVSISFTELQTLLESDDVERRLAQLARKLGHNATIKIKKREKVDHLTFPFKK